MNQQQVPTNTDLSTITDLSAIKQLIESAEKYQNDIDAFIPLHTDEVIIVNLAGRRVIGKESFYQAMKQALESPLANVITKIEINDIRFISPGVAIVSCVKHVSDERSIMPEKSNASLPSAGSLTYIVVKKQDKWKITLAQTTPIKQLI